VKDGGPSNFQQYLSKEWRYDPEKDKQSSEYQCMPSEKQERLLRQREKAA